MTGEIVPARSVTKRKYARFRVSEETSSPPYLEITSDGRERILWLAGNGRVTCRYVRIMIGESRSVNNIVGRSFPSFRSSHRRTRSRTIRVGKPNRDIPELRATLRPPDDGVGRLPIMEIRKNFNHRFRFRAPGGVTVGEGGGRYEF